MYDILLNSSQNEKYFRHKLLGKLTHILVQQLSFRKSCRLWENVENYCTAGQATHDNTTHALHTLGRATDIHSEYVILIAFPRYQWSRESASVLHLCVHWLSCGYVLPRHHAIATTSVTEDAEIAVTRQRCRDAEPQKLTLAH